MNIKPKILVVDDKPENLVAIRKVLRDLDVELVEASSGNNALKATLYNDFTLALLDVQMPDMDGYELASILREEEKTAHLPFIFISAVYTDNLNVFKGYEKGAFSFITKPFQPEILINKVKFFVEKHQQEIELFKLYKNLEKKNKELEYSNKEIESFSYSVSHDLRAPLRAVDGYAKMLEEDYSELFDNEGVRLLNAIQFNSQRMSFLIDDLLAFSRLGKKTVQKTELNMNILIDDILNTVLKTDKKKTKVKVNNLSPAMGDPSLINQVLLNLISNGIKYTSKKTNPLIEISSKTESGEVIYEIKDNGVGFDMLYVDKLFGVFQRLHSQEEFEGTGVGLAIVQRIINKHGGKVWAQAKLGEGATFSFTLPTI
ncbi:sensor histidine kinase [Aurantibacillus circumpalustris]|uniref:sensor histidine kinase n=1 Tax=Aurantibacillus circumpalustris TaxID=3036359 RepID=UPI00295B84FD|nr:ATP-binding protein [Aurantibacillus circumpalustris]